MAKSKVITTNELNDLLKSLQERIKTLESDNRELNIIITIKKNQIFAKDERLRYLTHELTHAKGTVRAQQWAMQLMTKEAQKLQKDLNDIKIGKYVAESDNLAIGS